MGIKQLFEKDSAPPGSAMEGLVQAAARDLGLDAGDEKTTRQLMDEFYQFKGEVEGEFKVVHQRISTVENQQKEDREINKAAHEDFKEVRDWFLTIREPLQTLVDNLTKKNPMRAIADILVVITFVGVLWYLFTGQPFFKAP